MNKMKFILGASVAIAAALLLAGCEAKPSEAKTLRLATYNVGAFRKYPTSSIDQMVKMMKELDLDAISLNELDSCNARGGADIYQLKLFADGMGNWPYQWGQALDYRGGGYGVGAAVKPEHKVIDKWSIQLPKSDDSEIRALAVIETEDFVFCATHLGLSQQSRADQMARINEEIAHRYPASDKPVFLCGDFNAEPESENIQSFLENWEQLTGTDVSFSTEKPRKCIDYIFRYRSSAPVEVVSTNVCYEFSSARPEDASDHFPVFLEVKPARSK